MKKIINRIIAIYKDISSWGNTTLDSKRRWWFALLLLPIIAIIVTSVMLIQAFVPYRVAKSEYDALREIMADVITDSLPASDPDYTSVFDSPSGFDLEDPIITEPARTLTINNPDYVAWIRIAGMGLDYPIVRGSDNEKYMDTTFGGNKNPAGTIFMDFRITDGFTAPYVILYGHNMRDGSMFGSLSSYQRDNFLKNHSHISIIKPNGQILNYRVFAAVLVDVQDEVFTLIGKDDNEIATYFATHNAPDNSKRFLVLSTCTRNNNDDERFLVFASLEN